MLLKKNKRSERKMDKYLYEMLCSLGEEQAKDVSHYLNFLERGKRLSESESEGNREEELRIIKTVVEQALLGDPEAQKIIDDIRKDSLIIESLSAENTETFKKAY